MHYTKEELRTYVEKVVSAGGVVTFDCKLNRDGSFDDVLRYIGNHLK